MDPSALERWSEASGPIRMTPAATALPADAEDTALLVAWAAREGVALVPRGAGTGMPGGNVGWGVTVDLTRLDAVGPLDAASGRVRAEAGAVAARMEELASRHQRFFPALPSSADRCTAGGMAANNAAGARSFRYGAVARWVHALEVVLADGSVALLERGCPHPRFAGPREGAARALGPEGLAWPAVRKNSSGYALDRFLPAGDPVDLMVGSEGTLGIITAVHFDLPPAPPARALVLLPVPAEALLDPLVAEVRAWGASACEFLGRRFLDVSGLRHDPDLGSLAGEHPALLLVELEGDGDAVEAAVVQVRAAATGLGVPVRVGRTSREMASLWRARHAASPVVAARAAEGLVSMQFIEDSVVPQGRLSRYLAGLDAILGDEHTDAVVFGHAGDGNVHVNPLVDVRRHDWRERVARILDRTVDLVASLGGTLAGEHGDGRVRAPFHVRIFGARTSSAFAAVKEAMDPRGILNPGVIVALPGQDPLLGLSPARRP